MHARTTADTRTYYGRHTNRATAATRVYGGRRQTGRSGLKGGIRTERQEVLPLALPTARDDGAAGGTLDDHVAVAVDDILTAFSGEDEVAVGIGYHSLVVATLEDEVAVVGVDHRRCRPVVTLQAGVKVMQVGEELRRKLREVHAAQAFGHIVKQRVDLLFRLFTSEFLVKRDDSDAAAALSEELFGEHKTGSGGTAVSVGGTFSVHLHETSGMSAALHVVPFEGVCVATSGVLRVGKTLDDEVAVTGSHCVAIQRIALSLSGRALEHAICLGFVEREFGQKVVHDAFLDVEFVHRGALFHLQRLRILERRFRHFRALLL